MIESIMDDLRAEAYDAWREEAGPVVRVGGVGYDPDDLPCEEDAR